MASYLTDQQELDIQNFVTQSQTDMGVASQKIASLEAENAQLKETQKTASAATVFSFDDKLVADVLDKMASGGLTSQDSLPALRQEIERDPSVVLTYLGKIASEVAFPAQPIGRSEKTASDNLSSGVNPNAESDAYWVNFMAGKY